jgi:hypothetical protein
MAEQPHPFDFGSPNQQPAPGYNPATHNNYIPQPGQLPPTSQYDAAPHQGQGWEQPAPGFGYDLKSDRITYQDESGNVRTGAAAIGGHAVKVALRGAASRIAGKFKRDGGVPQPAAPNPADTWNPDHSSTTGVPRYGTDYGHTAAPQPTYGYDAAPPPTYDQLPPAPGGGWGPDGYASPGAQGHDPYPQPPYGGRPPEYGPPSEDQRY